MKMSHHEQLIGINAMNVKTLLSHYTAFLCGFRQAVLQSVPGVASVGIPVGCFDSFWVSNLSNPEYLTNTSSAGELLARLA